MQTNTYKSVLKAVSISAFALAAFSGKALAADPIISMDLNFGDGANNTQLMSPTDLAGVDPVKTTNWGSAGNRPVGNIFSLKENSGVATASTFQLTNESSWYNYNNTAAPLATGDEIMMNTYGRSGAPTDVQADFLNLGGVGSGATYDLYTYYIGPGGSNISDIKIESSAPDIMVYTQEMPFVSNVSPYVYTAAASGSTSSSRTTSNYAVFSGLQANSDGKIKISVTGPSEQSTLSGVQLVVHEPTWVGNNNSAWTIGVNADWRQSQTPTAFTDGWWVRFDDTASAGSHTVTPSGSGPISVGRLTVSTTLGYTFNNGVGITGTGGLNKSGSGALTILGTNHTFTGDSVIQNGEVNVLSLGGGSGGDVAASAGGLGSGVGLKFGDGTSNVATLNYNAPSSNTPENAFRVISADAGSHGVINIANSSTLSVRAYDNAGTMEKAGPGKLVVRGGNSGDGGVWNITGGTFATVNTDGDHRDVRGNINVNSGATYESSDSHVGGADVLIKTGATLFVVPGVDSPQNDRRPLDFRDTSSLTLEIGSHVKFDLNNSLADSGQVLLLDTSSLVAGTGLTLEITSSLSVLAMPEMSWILFDGVAGGSSVNLLSSISSIDFGSTGWSGGELTYDEVNNDLILSGVTSVPEPTTFVTLMGGLGLLAGLRRFRRVTA